jgi:hypothetical protein
MQDGEFLISPSVGDQAVTAFKMVFLNQGLDGSQEVT